MRKFWALALIGCSSLTLGGCYSWSPLSDYKGEWRSVDDAKARCKGDTAPSEKFYPCMEKLGWAYEPVNSVVR